MTDSVGKLMSKFTKLYPPLEYEKLVSLIHVHLTVDKSYEPFERAARLLRKLYKDGFKIVEIEDSE